jgi:hypothetical protein
MDLSHLLKTKDLHWRSFLFMWGAYNRTPGFSFSTKEERIQVALWKPSIQLDEIGGFPYVLLVH